LSQSEFVALASVERKKLFFRHWTEKLSRRQKQHCTGKGDKHPSCVCLRNHRNVLVPAVVSRVTVTPAIVIFIVILFGIPQDWKYQSGGRENADLKNAVVNWQM